MIVARAPFRVTLGSGVVDVFAGDGTPPRSVLSCSTGLFMYATAHLRQDARVVAGYAQRENVGATFELDNRAIRTALARTRFEHGVEVHLVSEMPGKSAGMGGSAAVLCATLMTLYRLRGLMIDLDLLAKRAASIEIDDLKRTVGRQDHWGAAFGGFQRLTFAGDSVMRQTYDPDLLRFLDGATWLVPCGADGPRDAGEILAPQAKPENTVAINRLGRITDLMLVAVQAQDLVGVISLLAEAWELKRGLSSGVSTPAVDAVIAAIREFGGASKLCGAGGHGYVFAAVPRASSAAMLQRFPEAFQVRLGGPGCEVVYDSGQRLYEEGL